MSSRGPGREIDPEACAVLREPNQPCPIDAPVLPQADPPRERVDEASLALQSPDSVLT